MDTATIAAPEQVSPRDEGAANADSLAPIADDQEVPKPARPKADQLTKNRVREFFQDIADTAEWVDNCRQYRADQLTMFPDYAERARQRDLQLGVINDPALKDRVQMQRNFEVKTPHAYRYSQQTGAMVLGRGHSVRIKPKKKVPPPAGMIPKNDMATVVTKQFALTMQQEIEQEAQLSNMVPSLRRWVYDAIWFRVGILRLSWQREYLEGSVLTPQSRRNDIQDNLARLKALKEDYSHREFAKTDSEYAEMEELENMLTADGEIELVDGALAEVWPMNRFKIDPMVRTPAQTNKARWQDFILIMRRADVRQRFPFIDHGDGTWEGVHPDDLDQSRSVTPDGDLITEPDFLKTREENKRKFGDDRRDEELIALHEHWRLDTGTVYWLLEGIDYELGTWIPVRQGDEFYPTRVLVFNERPGTWAGMSDTEILEPVQSSMNWLDSMRMKALWLSLPRGFYPKGEMGDDEVTFPEPGKLAGIPGVAGIDDINKLITWLKAPFSAAAFDKTEQERIARFLVRIPEAAMGVTDGRTTATAIATANGGSAIAASDKQEVAKESIAGAYRQLGQMLILNRDTKDIMRRHGEWAVWPEYFDKREMAKAQKMVDEEVRQQVVQQLMAERTQAMAAGDPDPVPNPLEVDALIEHLTEAAWIHLTGFPKPMSRKELFQDLDIDVKVSMDGIQDKMARVQSLTQMVQMLGAIGVKVNPKSVAPLLAALLGEEDDIENVISADPNDLVAQLAQSVVDNPNELTPQAAQLLAQVVQQSGVLNQQLASPVAPGGAPPPNAAPAGAGNTAGNPPVTQSQTMAG